MAGDQPQGLLVTDGEALAGALVSDLAGVGLVTPGLVPPAAVAPHYLHLGAGASSVQAVVVRHDLPGLSESEHLVASEAVAGWEAQPAAALPAHRVEAEAGLGDGAEVVVVERQQGLRVDGLKVPAECLALQPLPQLQPGGNVAAVHLPGQRVETEVEMFPVVHPDLGQPGVVVVDYLRGPTREGVGGRLPEHVTHPTARGDQESSATHPDPERHLQVLTAPDPHTLVVSWSDVNDIM